MRHTYIAAALATFLLVSWGNDPALAAGSDEYANIHTVTIISKIGDALAIKKVGAIAFGNKEDKLPIPDWSIDKSVEDQVAQLISSRFMVRLADDQLRAAENVGDYVQHLPAEQRTDAYIVVGKTSRQDFESNQQITGLTVYRHELIFGAHHDYIYAAYVVSVMDSKTGKTIDYGSSSLNDSRLAADPPIAGNPEANWADDPASFTDIQKQNIQSGMTKLISATLVHAVRRAGLIQ